MRIDSVTIGHFPMSFRFAFIHSSAKRSTTENVIVAVHSDNGQYGWGEGCPRDYVTGETSKSAKLFIERSVSDFCQKVTDITSLESWIAANRKAINQNPAAFCALEMATLDALGKTAEITVEALLRHPDLIGSFRYSAVLGDSRPSMFALQMLRYRFAGFRDYKLKLSGDIYRDRSKLRWFRYPLAHSITHPNTQPSKQTQSETQPLTQVEPQPSTHTHTQPRRHTRIRVDANNLWSSPGKCIDHLRALNFALFAVEEPLSADDIEGCAEIAEALDTRIILDETLLHIEQLQTLPEPLNRWIINCRISKLGGVIRSLNLIKKAEELGIGVIIGAHVGETSLLTRAALTVAAATQNITAQEGAFGTYLLRQDLCQPSLRFGRGGKLVTSHALWTQNPGWGLEVDEAQIKPLAD